MKKHAVMKNAVILFFVVAAAIGCHNKKIDKVVVNYAGQGVYDSVEFTKPADLAIFEEFMNNKVATTDKFPAKYYLTVRYHTGKPEEYFGNGAAVKSNVVYTVTDKELAKKFTALVYSGLPDSLRPAK